MTAEQQDMRETDPNPPTLDFFPALEARWEMGNFVCVGLDPVLKRIPQSVKDANPETRDAVFEFTRAIIDATADLVCAFKPNAAFYEALGADGHDALVRTVAYIHEKHPGIPVIYDAKRGDIGSTNEGYVTSAFEEIGADAITVNPYFGREAIQPFLDRKDKGIIILARTSNKGANELQNRLVKDDDGNEIPLYLLVAKKASTEWNTNGNVGLVVGATAPAELALVREVVGDTAILIPGIGAQGGEVEASVKAGKDSRSQGMMINLSRNVLYASDGPDFASAGRAEVLQKTEEINRFRLAA